MNDVERPVAVALLTQAQLDRLGSSLKHVFRIEDSGKQFEDLLREFNESDGRVPLQT
jgi:hypothetical protein